MGGSGGSYFTGEVTPEQLARRTREAEAGARSEAFESQVADYLASLLAQYNDRDIDSTRTVFGSLKRDLENEVEGTIDLLYGGSVSKHTYVDGLSDVDALVLMDRTELAERSPRELQQVLAACLRSRYGSEAVSTGQLAVTLHHRDQTIQLLPALRDGARFMIASSDGNGWSRINPDGFATALTKTNKAMNGKLVPCIKLAKAVIAGFPEQQRLTGYHTESLAIAVFKSYDGPKTPKAMLKHFFDCAPECVLHPIRDSSGQSIYVDEYLGPANSLKRRIVADALARVARRIRNADGAKSIEGWKGLFE